MSTDLTVAPTSPPAPLAVDGQPGTGEAPPATPPSVATLQGAPDTYIPYSGRHRALRT